MPDLSHQLQEQVHTAYQTGTPLSIQGGNSKHWLGRPTAPGTDILSLQEHSGIVEYQPVELIITARAGTKLTELIATLDQHEQMLAFEPPIIDENATLGGTLACNLSGPARPWQGSIRDHVLGTRLINGKGEHLRFGGQVMKNVAGYDVSRLQAGAMGTLGVLTEISLKVLPKPAHCLTLVDSMDIEQAILIMNQRARQAKPMNAACWYQGKLYTRLAGAESAVEATAKQWGGERLEKLQTRLFWQQLCHQQLDILHPQDDKPLWRFSVQSSAKHDESLPGEWLVDWGGAQRWYRGHADFDDMVTIAERMNGQVTLYRGGERNGNIFHPKAAMNKKLHMHLKQSFDPKAIFNINRLYHWM